MSKLAAPQPRDTFFSWTVVVGDLFPVYPTGHKMKKYASWIIPDIDFSF